MVHAYTSVASVLSFGIILPPASRIRYLLLGDTFIRQGDSYLRSPGIYESCAASPDYDLKLVVEGSWR